MHLYLATYNNPCFWRSEVYRMQTITNLAQERTDSSGHRTAVRVKEGQGGREKEKIKIRVATNFEDVWKHRESDGMLLTLSTEALRR